MALIIISLFLSIAQAFTPEDQENIDLRGRVLAAIDSWHHETGMGEHYNLFVFGVESKGGEGQSIVTPVLITYYSDLDLPESFFDHSKLYELRVRRSVSAETPLKSVAYVRFFDSKFEVEIEPPKLILRLLEGCPKDILKMDMVLPHYEMSSGDYRAIKAKNRNAQGEKPKSVPYQLQQDESLDLCTIDEHINQYKEGSVRVHSYINSGWEGTVLYDPKCPVPMAHVVFKPNVSGKLKSFRNAVKKGDAFVIVEGIVHGPRPYPIHPKLPESFKAVLSKEVLGYGHMGNCNMEIEVERILDVKSIEGAILAVLERLGNNLRNLRRSHSPSVNAAQ